MDKHIEKCFTHKDDWREWLSENYTSCSEIWLVYYKKDSQKNSISYDDSVEQALCFGWIDGIVKSIDAEKYKRRFTPRINVQNWSPSNIKRAKKLIENGEMTQAGLNVIGNYQQTKSLVWPENNNMGPKDFSEELSQMLKSDQKAFEFYQSLSPSHKKRYLYWIMSAKKEETRIKRMKEALILLNNKTISLLK